MQALRPTADRPATAPPPCWPAEALWEQLLPLRPGLSVEVLAEADSTNTRLLERARAGDTAPCLLVAERQTAGRGRLGRHWVSDTAAAAAGGPASLTFSLGLVLAPADWSGLSLAIGVALAETLGPQVRLKWPNDLWLVGAGGGTGRKLGGVLIETLPLAAPLDGGRYAVVGIGINLEAPAPQPGLPPAVAGWREVEPGASAPDLLAQLARPLLQLLVDFERTGFPVYAARYAARDALAGLPVRTTHADAPEGRADGVDGRGALRVQTAAGVRLVSGGEVSVRPC